MMKLNVKNHKKDNNQKQIEMENKFLSTDVKTPKNVSHNKWSDYLENKFNKKGNKILEIGSREVTCKSSARKRYSNADYMGFDYYNGNNVDVVGDVHKISSYFKNEKFDLIYTSACFEHFAMPWIVAVEISKLLKVGGHIFIETHFSFSSHERPWHFFQYSDIGLNILFNKKLGFKCIESGMSNPIIGRFSVLSDDYLRNRPVPGLYCHSEFYGKKIKNVDNFNWNNINLEDIINTKYPKNK